jgi:hypothetical protein
MEPSEDDAAGPSTGAGARAAAQSFWRLINLHSEAKAAGNYLCKVQAVILSMPTPIEHRTASQTGRTPGPALSRNPLIPQEI